MELNQRAKNFAKKLHTLAGENGFHLQLAILGDLDTNAKIEIAGGINTDPAITVTRLERIN